MTWPFPPTPLPNKPGEPKKAQEIELVEFVGMRLGKNNSSRFLGGSVLPWHLFYCL